MGTYDRYSELVQQGFQGLGWANDHPDHHPLVAKCREQKHRPTYEKVGHCLEVEYCDTCKIVTLIDSSD